MRIITTAKALGMVAALGLMGCGEGTVRGEASAGTTTSTTGVLDPTSTTAATPDPTTTSTTTGGIDLLEGADTAPKSGPGGATTYGQLVDVTMGRHEGFDRVVFTFEDGAVPAYLVEYLDPPITEDASGQVLDIEGDAFLYVRLEPASAYDMEAGEESYTGPDRLEGSAAGLSEVMEVVKAGDFEAVLGWAIGLADEVDFRVDTLSNPGRIVVDVRNH